MGRAQRKEDWRPLEQESSKIAKICSLRYELFFDFFGPANEAFIHKIKILIILYVSKLRFKRRHKFS